MFVSVEIVREGKRQCNGQRSRVSMIFQDSSYGSESNQTKIYSLCLIM
jgi:hypothetical protein